MPSVTISYRSIFSIVFVILFLLFIYHAINVLMLFFVSFIIMSSLYPLVERLTAWKIPKVVSVLSVFLMLIILLGGLLSITFIPFIRQVPQIISNVTPMIENVFQAEFINWEILEQEIGNVSQQALGFTLGLFENIFAILTVIIASIYFLFERDTLYAFLSKILGKKGKRTQQVIYQVEKKLGAWLRGQVILAVIVGVTYYIILTLLGVEYALSLAVLGALFEFIPIIGPILAAVPAVLVGLMVSPLTAGLVAFSYLIIQQLESHALVPILMNKAVGLNPLLIIFAIAVGGTLLGFAGVLLAVPIVAVIQILFEELTHYNNPSK